VVKTPTTAKRRNTNKAFLSRCWCYHQQPFSLISRFGRW
jgi:hypothetical protein